MTMRRYTPLSPAERNLLAASHDGDELVHRLLQERATLEEIAHRRHLRCAELEAANRALRGVPVPLKVRIFGWPGHPLPAYQTALAAGADAHARLDEAVVLHPGERLNVPLGFAVELPEGWEIQVRPRSGLALQHGISIVNAPGTVDADYRGQVHANLVNLGTWPFTIRPRDRVAQVVLCPVRQAAWEAVTSIEDLSPTARGANGHGSTGR